LDGAQRQTTVLDGEERIELLTTRPNELAIESCTEVRDLRQLGGDKSPNTVRPASVQFLANCTWLAGSNPVKLASIPVTVSAAASKEEKVAAAELACEPLLAPLRRECNAKEQKVQSKLSQIEALSRSPATANNPAQRSRYNLLVQEYNSLRDELLNECP
jgi:hypothetical protein